MALGRPLSLSGAEVTLHEVGEGSLKLKGGNACLVSSLERTSSVHLPGETLSYSPSALGTGAS